MLVILGWVTLAFHTSSPFFLSVCLSLWFVPMFVNSNVLVVVVPFVIFLSSCPVVVNFVLF